MAARDVRKQTVDEQNVSRTKVKRRTYGGGDGDVGGTDGGSALVVPSSGSNVTSTCSGASDWPAGDASSMRPTYSSGFDTVSAGHAQN